MSYAEIANSYHGPTHNCAQAVFCCCCDKLDIDEETAYKISAFFGGGVRKGEICGAVSGALMALGMKYADENHRACTKSEEFLDAFVKEFGTLRCGELAPSEPSERKNICPAFISFCADYLEEEFK